MRRNRHSKNESASDPETRRLGAAIRAFDLPRKPFDDLIEGVCWDLEGRRYATAAELRETFLKLARESGATAILITHQLEEAIAVGDRIAVFGQSAKLLADIHVARWAASDYPVLREAIQQTLQNQKPDPRLQD